MWNLSPQFLCDGRGGLVSAVSVPIQGGPIAIASGDVDADGDPDLRTANRDASSAAIAYNNCVPG